MGTVISYFNRLIEPSHEFPRGPYPEPASGVRNRHRSVAHGVQLVEAARLKPGRHQEDVAPEVGPRINMSI